MRKPNILLINCDDLGYGDLSCYGSSKNSTPNLDLLAREGIRFTDFYTASPVCSPSRGALMTGCYPPRIGFNDFEGRWVLFPGQGIGLNPDEKTIASVLKDAGYQTMMIGKWHCGDQEEFLPGNHGFDHYYGLPYSNDMGIQVGCDEVYPPLPLLSDTTVIEEQPDQTSLTERYTENAVRFIRSHREQPFFLYFAHMYVHVPIYVPNHLRREEKSRYSSAVEYIDLVTGILLDELDRLGIREDTIVIFTSDNGSRDDWGGSNAPLRGTKATTWEGGQRVPMIFNWKGTGVGGSECDEIVCSLDLSASLAKLAGTHMPDDRIIDGMDLSDLLLGKTKTSKRDTFLYYGRKNLEAVRAGDYKLHVWRNDAEVKELYNLREDIGETINIYQDNPEIVARIMDVVNRARHDMGDGCLGIRGENIRPIGKIKNAKPLTTYEKDRPYIVPMYDLDEHG